MEAIVTRPAGWWEPEVNVSWRPLGHLERRPVGWLWPGRVPLGKMSLLVGDPGRGKSLLALDMAARVSRGLPWPDACGTFPTAEGGCGTSGPTAEGGCATSCAPVGSVMLLSAEDDAEDTILPRLEAAGGDPNRVVVLRIFGRKTRAGELPFSLARDVGLLEGAVMEQGDVRLVVLDPLSAYLTGLDTYRNSGVRAALALVRDMAEGTGVAVVGVSHLTKRSEASVLYRSSGSVAFVAASRAVWAVGPDRAEPGRMLFLPAKCNLAGGMTGLAYRIVPSAQDPAVPVVAWEAGAVTVTAEEAFGARTPVVRRRDEAAMWLAGLLTAGPMATAQVERLAAAAGFSSTAVRRARSELGVVSFHGGRGNTWALRLPGQDAPGLAPLTVEEQSAEAGGCAPGEGAAGAVAG